MNWTWKLAIPIGLGVLAAVLNFVAARSGSEPLYFVRVVKDVNKGERFTEDSLAKVALPVHVAGSLGKTAVPWHDRPVLFQRVSPRKLTKGDLVLWQDAEPPPAALDLRAGEVALHLSLEGISNSLPVLLNVGSEVSFLIAPTGRRTGKTTPPQEPVEIGPFRVLSIGRRLSPDATDKGDDREITLAVHQEGPGQFDKMTRQLLAARLARQEGSSTGIVAVLLHRPGPTEKQ